MRCSGATPFRSAWRLLKSRNVTKDEALAMLDHAIAHGEIVWTQGP